MTWLWREWTLFCKWRISPKWVLMFRLSAGDVSLGVPGIQLKDIVIPALYSVHALQNKKFTMLLCHNNKPDQLYVNEADSLFSFFQHRFTLFCVQPSVRRQ